MGTITKIRLSGHEIRFERKSVGGVYQNVYIRHVGTNNRLTDAMRKANIYVESLFAIGLSRYATIPEFRSFVYDEDLRLQKEAEAEMMEDIELRDRIADKERAEQAVIDMMALSTYPKKGCTTVIDTVNKYEGYFANTPPGSSHYAFVPQPGWTVTYAKRVPELGTHGCCPNCIVTHIVVKRIDPIAEPVIEGIEGFEEETDYTPILILGGAAVILFMMLKK